MGNLTGDIILRDRDFNEYKQAQSAQNENCDRREEKFADFHFVSHWV